jgi:hypothetical protein
MIKALKKSSIVLTPFIAQREWSLSNVINEDVVLTEAGEGVTMEFADYGNGSGFPVINTDCLIALEQQEGDRLTVREGQKRTGIFYPDSEPTNQDGTFKRVVYSQIKSTFYNKSLDPTKTFGLEHIDIPSSRTQKFLLNSLYVVDVPTRIMGEKIQPETVRMIDVNSDDEATISDDGHNNLYASRDIFWKKQEVGDFNNEFATGSFNNCSTYFDFSVPDAPVSLSVSSGSAVLNWQFTSSSPSRQLGGFVVERSFADETNYSILNYVPSSSVGGYVDTDPPQGLVFYRVYAFNTFGNSSAVSKSIDFTPGENFSYEPATANVDWEDGSGPEFGNLAYFLSNASIPDVTYLDILNQEVTSVTGLDLFVSAEYIRLSQNLLTTIPTLPETGQLEQFHCQLGIVDTITNLPASLTVIALGGNSLLDIPSIPSGVTQLDVSFNPFSAAKINSICGELVANGLNDGLVILTNCTTSLAGGNISTLQSRGWLVFT